MKILVDSTISFKEDWFELIPLNITIDGKDFLDYNDNKNTEKIINSKKRQTSFLSPYYVEKNIKKGIIFTIPSKLSGQFNSYKNHFKDNKDILILDGVCLTTKKNEAKKILSETNDFSEITKRINELNKSIEYDALVFNLSKIPSKGRVKFLFTNILDMMNTNVWLKFKNGEWKKILIKRNSKKLINRIMESKKGKATIWFNSFDEKSEKIVSFIKEKFKNVDTLEHNLTNAMLCHVSQFFIVII